MSKTVLLADDNPSVRRSLKYLLESRGCDVNVEEAADGVDAIELAKRSKPDLILLDLAMPRLNGAEAANVLKRTLPETPIILFTMFTDLEANALCGFISVDFVSKIDGVPKLLERFDALLPNSNDKIPPS